MTTTVSAAAIGLPASIQAMPRRGFLAGLARLPLIGGSVALIGQPKAVAEPVTEQLLWGYKDWLFYEHRMLSYELVGYDEEQARLVERLSSYAKAGPAGDWHFRFPTREGSRFGGLARCPAAFDARRSRSKCRRRRLAR